MGIRDFACDVGDVEGLGDGDDFVHDGLDEAFGVGWAGAEEVGVGAEGEGCDGVPGGVDDEF